MTAALRRAAGPGATVTTLSETVATIGSSLSSVDLHGLTGLELGFALAYGVAAGGLVLALSLAERRRTLAVTRALGARPRQVAAFVVGEAAVVAVLGLVLGAMFGAALSRVLVAVLSGVFDPPPSTVAVPWSYLTVLAAAVVCSVAVACGLGLRWAGRATVALLREA